MVDEEKKLKTLHMGDILTGSGLKSRDEDIYSRDAHRRRSLELYSSRPGSPHHETREPSNSILNSKFPVELETFVMSRKPEEDPEVAVKEDQVEQQELPEHMISVSGNYIAPPPGTLSFARRTGKFYPASSASVDVGSSLVVTPPAVKRRAHSEQVPQLRIHSEPPQF